MRALFEHLAHDPLARNRRTPLLLEELRRLLAAADPATLAGDRGGLLVGYYFVGLRSKLVALGVEALVEVAQGCASASAATRRARRAESP